MNALLNKPLVRIGVPVLLLFFATFRIFGNIGLENRPATGYDEQMWTSASVSSWAMFAQGHVRPTKELDNWFPTYAWKHELDIFTGEKWSQGFNPDTVTFPYDYITLENENQGYSQLIKYDTLKFPRKDFQWFDRATWTFGWKAPNLGKYLMGAWLAVSSEGTNPNGYFKFETPEGKPSGAPFAYTPPELVAKARIINALFTLGSLLLVLWLGGMIQWPVTGWVAALLLLLNQDFIDVNTAVGLDSFVVFFSLLSAAFLIKTFFALQKEQGIKPIFLWAAATGLALGGAVSSKLNGAMMVVAAALAFAWLAYWAFKHKKTNKVWVRKFIGAGLLTGGLPVLLFVVLNPQVWHEPVGRAKALQESADGYFEKRAVILTFTQFYDPLQAMGNSLNARVQSGRMDPAAFQGLVNQLNSFGAKIQNDRNKPETYAQVLPKRYAELQKIHEQFSTAADTSVMEDAPFYNWVAIKNEFGPAFGLMIKRTGIHPGEGPGLHYYGTFGNLIPIKNNPLDLLLLVFGLLVLLLAWYKGLLEHRMPAVVMLLCTVMVVYGNTNFLWQDWSRYFTVFLPWYSLISAFGLIYLLQHKKEVKRLFKF